MRRHTAFAPEPYRLHDGRELIVRPIRPDDAAELQALAGRLSAHALRLRFFSPITAARLAALERGHFFPHLAEVDFKERGAWVAHVPGEAAIRAVGRYQRQSDPAEAEIAFVVEEPFQGQGVCTELLHHLAAYANTLGIYRLIAVVLAENIGMIEVLRQSGYPYRMVGEGEVDRLTLDIASPAKD
ncbi:MAG: GNAT family N-acetyltransferase [Dehalococcoidia bacterium]|nr:GNAT family N-acetyltransferase [Dehalococcoidia bacterium]